MNAYDYEGLTIFFDKESAEALIQQGLEHKGIYVTNVKIEMHGDGSGIECITATVDVAEHFKNSRGRVD